MMEVRCEVTEYMDKFRDPKQVPKSESILILHTLFSIWFTISFTQSNENTFGYPAK